MKILRSKYYFALLFLTATLIFPQETDNKLLNQKIKAIARANQNVYLILDDKAVKMDINKVYEEYYKTIYQDTSIVNPNTILNSGKIEIIPIIDIMQSFTSYKYLSEDIFLYNVFEKDSSGNLIPQERIYSVIDKKSFPLK
ncbi:MAG: hypothetical protein JEY94_02100 [Melioribacteraceae bacterium]|nr:hypothetical protein [Melioribacteraceae bacterium]